MKLLLHFRIRPIWVSLFIFYITVVFIIYIFKVPWKSKSKSILHGDLLKSIQKRGENYNKKYLEIKSKPEEENVNLLISTFKRADENQDELLDRVELSTWIALKIKEHFTSALKENIFIFTAIDLKPRNGEISWEEYLHHFFKNKGYDEDFIKNQGTSLKGMPREIKEAIMRDKAAWSEAARDDPTRLSLDEFLAFRHPESSHASILSLVDQILGRLDVDNDGELTEDEFSDPDLNEVSQSLTNEQLKVLRKEQFKKVIDKDGNGKAERKELLKYFDPRSIHHAEKDSDDLFSLADADSNGYLSLDEVLTHKNAFIASKMFDVAKSFHDEF